MRLRARDHRQTGRRCLLLICRIQLLLHLLLLLLHTLQFLKHLLRSAARGIDDVRRQVFTPRDCRLVRRLFGFRLTGLLIILFRRRLDCLYAAAAAVILLGGAGSAACGGWGGRGAFCAVVATYAAEVPPVLAISMTFCTEPGRFASPKIT